MGPGVVRLRCRRDLLRAESYPDDSGQPRRRSLACGDTFAVDALWRQLGFAAETLRRTTDPLHECCGESCVLVAGLLRPLCDTQLSVVPYDLTP